MTTLKPIKISQKNYERLVKTAANLSKKEGRPMSIDKALTYELTKKEGSLLDLALLANDKDFLEALEQVHKETRSAPERTYGGF